MKKLRVLHVLLSLEIGGMEQVAADLIKHLDSEQFIPVVACLESLGPIADELIRQGIEVVKVDKMIPILSFFYPGKLIKLIKKYRIDIVHVHSGCWHKAALAAKLCGLCNIIYTEHGRIFPDSRVVMLLDRFYSPLTKTVVVVSENLAEYMCIEVGIPAKKIKIIINGIDVERFQVARNPVVASENIRIGIIARLAPVKDISTLVRAMVIIHQRKPDMQLTIVGDGPERESLESLVKTFSLTSVVTFLGFRRDIPTILKDIDIFTLSSLSEGTSITLLEAMAAGKPVVVTNVGGNPAVVEEGVNGFLVPSGNSDALAHALLQLAENISLMRDISSANIHTVTQHYSIQVMARHYESLYRESLC